MAGLFDNPFKSGGRSKTQVYLYAHPQVDLVGYDATLQGGLFTHNSPYTIGSEKLTRTVFRCDGGLRAGYHGLQLSVYARYLTKEFASGRDHATAGLELAFAL